MQKIAKKHIPIILEIYNQCFPTPWKKDDFISLLNSPATNGYILDSASFIIIQTIPPEAEIITIATHPKARGKGLAKQLLNKICEDYNKVFLEVRQSNTPAISLYKSTGFIRTGIREKYYNNSENAIMMTFEK